MKRRLCFSFLFLGLMPIAGCSSALAAESRCEVLFAQGVRLTQASSARLNEPSREYLLRVKYLVSERRLFGPELLETILASEHPVNPLGEKPRTLNLAPHHEAFVALLKEDLQWNEIRTALRPLTTEKTQEQQRTQGATEQTQDVLIPLHLKTFPFAATRAVRTPKGQELALVATTDGKNQIMTVSAHDLATGKQVASTSFAGLGDFAGLQAQVVGDKVMVTIPEWSSNDVVSFVLDGQTTLRSANDPWFKSRLREHKFDDAVKHAHFVDYKGKLAVVTFKDYRALFYDPLNQHQLDSIEVSAEPRFLVDYSGAIDGTVFAARKQGSTYVIDPTAPTPVIEIPKMTAIAAFQHQGQALGLAVDWWNTYLKDTVAMKILDFKTRQDLGAFTLAARTHWPVLQETFEADGTVYGVISTDLDVYTVDLVKGVISKRLSEGMGDRFFFDWPLESAHQHGFWHKGRYYLLGLDRETFELVILDALTLRPMLNGYKIDHPSWEMTSVMVVPGDGPDLKALISFKDGTSQLISLVKRL